MTPDAPGVSIVTPAFNAAAYIGETIASVQAQSHAHWELLIADDCSRDATRALVREIAASDPRVRLIEREQNGGPALARQSALDRARFRYVAFLDSDDMWLPQKLERQLAFMHARDAAFSFTEFRRVTADGSRLGQLVRVPSRLTYSNLLGNTAIATSTVLIDREVTGTFAMTDTYYDDFVLWLGILKRGIVAHGLKEDLMRYRVTADSWSRNKVNSAREVWRTYREVEKLSLARSAWSFSRYAGHALLKYRRF